MFVYTRRIRLWKEGCLCVCMTTKSLLLSTTHMLFTCLSAWLPVLHITSNSNPSPSWPHDPIATYPTLTQYSSFPFPHYFLPPFCIPFLPLYLHFSSLTIFPSSLNSLLFKPYLLPSSLIFNHFPPPSLPPQFLITTPTHHAFPLNSLLLFFLPSLSSHFLPHHSSNLPLLIIPSIWSSVHYSLSLSLPLLLHHSLHTNRGTLHWNP